MTRTGKIARLPPAIREELNRRLANHEPGTRLVPWLNSRPAVKKALKTYFHAQPITEQNLSEWKTGGFEDWLRHQECRALVRSLVDEAKELQQDVGEFSVTSMLSTPLALALGTWIRSAAQANLDDPANRESLLAAARELSKLRAGDQQEQWLRISRERWAADQYRSAAKREMAAKMEPFILTLMAENIARVYDPEIMRTGKMPITLINLQKHLKAQRKAQEAAKRRSATPSPPA